MDIRRDSGQALDTVDPDDSTLPSTIDDVWAVPARVATVGIFGLVLVGALYLSRAILLPVLAATLIGLTLAPLVKRARGFGIPQWVTALVLVGGMLAAAGLMVTLLASPVAEWIGRAPEIGASIKQKFYVFDRPLAALRELWDVLAPVSDKAVAVESPQISMVTPVIAFVTPAMVQIVLFIGTLLFFLSGQVEYRRYMASLFSSREAKLRFIRISNDIENCLASYVMIVTAINFCVGVAVTAGAWLFGLPNPLIFGLVAMMLNYVPYIGAGCMAIVLLGVGLVTFQSIGQALLAPACFVGLAVIEGNVITPTVLGRHLTLGPMVVFLALAFWAWLWGPMGAFLAVPLSVVMQVIFNHLFPSDEPKLPG